MPYMYILVCNDGSYYTGSTWNLEKRLYEHQQGLGANHTAKRLPVKLIYCEEYDRIEDAFRREKQVQGWSRKKKEALMAGDTNMLHHLAVCRNETGFDFAQPPYGFAQPPYGSAQPPHNCAQTSQNFDKTSNGSSESLDFPRPSSEAKIRSLSEAEGHSLTKAERRLNGTKGRSLSEAEGNTAKNLKTRHVLDVHREDNGK